jgi:type I restriction enzyme M protein
MEEISANGFNLNISRYVSTAPDVAEIDLAATHAELIQIEADIGTAKNAHNEYLK